MTEQLRYQARYRNGYWVVIDTTTGETVPPPSGHYKAHRDGYHWDYAAGYEALRLNEEAAKKEAAKN